jgi:hypothetical protein
MKTKSILFLAVLILVLSSCLVKSLHPFFKEKDVVMKKEIMGTWTDQKSGKWIISQAKTKKAGSDSVDSLLNYYNVSLTDKDGISKFISHLFKLNNQLFVDFFPDEVSLSGLTSYHIVATHSIAKIEVFKDSINIKWFNEQWLKNLFENNKIRISHEVIYDEDGPYILTASTDELQKFLIKYGNDPKAFKPDTDPKAFNPDTEFCYSLKRIKI